MKILKLDLRAFGPFTGLELDLSGGREGLHVIYGPNEAGKTSALRALEQMLFGIPGQSGDDFVHPYKDLRVGATLGLRDGRHLPFLRRKAAKGTLLAEDNQTILNDDAIAPFLGSLDKDLFSTMFGLGHEQLIHGGKEIVQGSGNVGQLLFAAGAGLADLQAVQDQLEKQATGLFKPRGKQRINQNLKALDEAKKKIRHSQLPSEDWERHQQALAAARARRTELADRLLARQSEKNRLERIRQSLGPIVRRKDVLRQLEALGEVRILPADFAERRRAASEGLGKARDAAERTQEELQRIALEIAPLTVPEELLAQAEEIERLPDELGSHRKAHRDLPGLLARYERAKRDVAAIFEQIRLPAQAAERLRLSGPQQIAIQKLGKRHEALGVKIQQAMQEIEDAERELAAARKQAAELEKPRDRGPLKDALRRAQNQGDLEAQFVDARAKLGVMETKAAIDLKKLPLWSGTLEELEQVALPSSEAIEGCAAQLAEADKQLARLDEKLDQLQSDRADAERKLEQLDLEGEVPTEGDLATARNLRDAGWQLVREAWRQGEPSQERLAEFLGRFPTGLDLAAAYERSVEAADEIADRLRREANRVAQRAGYIADRRDAERQIERATEKRQQAVAEREKICQAWRESWRPAGVDPLGPQEMRSWLAQQRSLVQQAESLRGQKAAVEQIAGRIETHRAELLRCLNELEERDPGEVSISDAKSLAAVLQRGQSLLDRLAVADERRERTEREIQRFEKARGDACVKSQRAAAELKDWTAQWTRALEPLGLPVETTPETADQVLPALKEAADLSERIEAIHHDAGIFRETVKDLVSRVAPDMADRPFEQAAEQLVARLRQATIDRQKRDELVKQQKRHQGEQQKARQAIVELTARLTAMCQEAGCDGPEKLPEAERASEEAGRLRETLAALEEQLAAQSAGAAIEAFIAEAEAAEADQLPGRIEQLDEEVRTLEHDRDEAQRTIGGEEQQLAAMDAGADATDASEQAQDLLARVGADTAEYVRLRMALAILRDGIERYRKKNEGPVLGRAGELFRRLTLASFEGLCVDFDDRGQSQLKGVRPDSGSRVELSGMSDGTADQLYLALRLASLENYLNGKEPVPLVLDDILVSFDDGRAAIALEIVAEISQRTQVIFFTHHAHLVEIARQRLDSAMLFVHRLGPEPDRTKEVVQ